MKDIDGYVTKDNLYRLISRIKGNSDFVVDAETCIIIIKAISDMSKADVQPIKHGRWIDGCCEIECSCCNTRYHDDIINMCYDWSNDKINYCPNCGARMDGEQND